MESLEIKHNLYRVDKRLACVDRDSKRIADKPKQSRIQDVQLSATQANGVIPQEEYERLIGRKVVKIQFHLDKRKHVELDDFMHAQLPGRV